MKNHLADSASTKLLAALLYLTRSGRGASIEEIVAHSKCSLSQARVVLADLSLQEEGGLIRIPTQDRLKLAIQIARSDILEGSKSLTWQEFEAFTERCLCEAGFSTRGNVTVEGRGRDWQIDVVGYRKPLLLAFDCKHWKASNYLSKFSRAAARQRQAVSYLAEVKDESINPDPGPVALPVILTLHNPPQMIHEGSVLLAIDKLPDFLGNITPLSTELPFILPQEV